MIALRDRLWLTQKYRSDKNECPLCSVPIKWIYDGVYWILCDQEPVLVYVGYGKKRAVVYRELLSNCHYYRDGEIVGPTPVFGHEPHVFTCDSLKKLTGNKAFSKSDY